MRAGGNYSKFIFQLVIRVFICAFIGTALLIAVYMIPASKMEKNIASSAKTLENSPNGNIFSWCTSALDNFTDSVILLTAGHENDENVVVRAMTASRSNIEGGEADPTGVLTAHYLYGEDFDSELPYSRYWHGYLIFIKILLCFTDYYGIRIINAIVQTMLLIALLYLLFKKNMKEYILPYIISVALLMPGVLALSIQYSSCYYILTLGSIAVVLLKDKMNKKDAFVFLYIGIATAFFDFFTYPIATLGVPAVFYFCMQKRVTLKNAFSRIVKVCFSWGLGYGLMWISKWIIASIIIKRLVIFEGIFSAWVRSSLNNASLKGSVFEDMRFAVKDNINQFFNTPATIFMKIIVISSLILILIITMKRILSLKDLFTACFPFLILACMPIVWYVLIANHSIIHSWFTNKALVVSAFAIMCALIKVYHDTKETAKC